MSLHHFEQPPPYPHDLNDLKLPDLPAATFRSRTSPQLPTLEPLPSLRSITNGLDAVHNIRPDRDALHKPFPGLACPDVKSLQLPGIHTMVNGDLPTPTDVALVSAMDENSGRREHSVSMQDLDDRMAAEALCGLGKVESNRSQPGFDQYNQNGIDHRHVGATNQETEPLLSLLASSHPWLGGTINGSLSAYSSTKSYSPRFIQYGADLIERSIGSPVASTVGTVGRRTGVEGSLRRYLGSRRPSELERIDPEILDQDISNKRRRLAGSDDDDMQVEQVLSEPVHRTVSGHSSVDTLPAYDENRSPAYEESTAVIETPKPRHQQFRPSANRSWSTQLMISTSGLGAALNEASLRSLKYCLHILRSANTHVRNLMDMLKRLLSDYERAPYFSRRLENGKIPTNGDAGADHVEYASPYDPQATTREDAETIAQRIRHLNDEIWNTLKNVVTSVSRYTGGALPDDESGFVRSQLMSVPRRWQRAISRSEASSAEAQQQGDHHDAVGSAHRMLAFALEGLDMMELVGGAVDSTIKSAEGWLERMGRGTREDGEIGPGSSVVGGEGETTPTPMDCTG